MNPNTYHNMMSNPPIIEKNYLLEVLSLSKTQQISNIEISQIVESNTSLIIKFKILITEADYKVSIRHFFIKTIKYNLNAYHDLSLKEVSFYKFIKKLPKAYLPIVKCFDAYISEDKQEYLLLFEDVSKDFNAPDNIDLSSESIWHCSAVSLAKFHAAFWDSDKIGSIDLPIESREEIDYYIRNTYESYNKFIKYVGDRFDPETRKIYDQAIRISVKQETERYERLINRANVTLHHGDSHIYNFMFPNNKKDYPLIVDFQFWRLGLGVSDVAHLTRDSFPGTEELHISTLEKYYETLLSEGVHTYSWETCWNDYRKQVATMLLIPMWQYTAFNLEYSEWSKDLSSLISNYKVLHCENL